MAKKNHPLFTNCFFDFGDDYIVKTFTFKSIQPKFRAIKTVSVSDSAVAHLQQGIRFKTVSLSNSAKIDRNVFLAFHQYLAKTYPLIHQKLQLEKVGFTLIYTWKGKNVNLKPVILMAHQDVVPVEKASLSQWKADPFGGIIQNGKILGRGAADDKSSLFALNEKVAVEEYKKAIGFYYLLIKDLR